MKEKKILVGTSKGLVIFKKSFDKWIIESVLFVGLPVTTIYVNELSQTWWIGIAHRHWGQKIHFSKDSGATWQEIPPPKYPKAAILGSGKPATLKKIWCMAGAGRDNPDKLWVGTEPGGLFTTNRINELQFDLVEGLWNHPSRKDENQWFGAGRDHPFIHSIVVDPRDSDHIYIAVSCAGVFETLDGGQTWAPKNKGLIAAYLPNPNVEVGHDPHLLLACKSNPNVLWQQNHCGIFRTTNGGDYWENITDKKGLANYGFALTIDDDNPERAWVIPATSDEIRVAVDLSLCVCKTEDGGKTWESLRNGLPQSNSFDIVFRHSFANYKSVMAFGTTTGNLYLSENYGEDWVCLSNNLARIDAIVFS